MESVLPSLQSLQDKPNVGRQQIYSETEDEDRNHNKNTIIIIKVIYYGIFEPDGSTSL